MKRFRVVALRSFLVFSIIAIVYVAGFGRIFYSGYGYNGDFVAFYCGGSVARLGGDPYRVEPLRSCEQGVSSAFKPGGSLVLPDPVPPYVLPFFEAFSILPYGVAQVLWSALILAALFAIVFLIRCEVQIVTSLQFIGVSLGLVSLYLGQTPVFTTLGIVLFSYAVTYRSFLLTIAACVCVMFEPQFAAVLVVAVWIFGDKRVRLGTILAGCIAVLGSSALISSSLWFEYFRDVLPSHVLSELSNEEQFGLASVLYSIHVSSNHIREMCSLIFVVSVTTSVIVAFRRRHRDSVLIAFCGVIATSILVSPFSHVTEVGIASFCAVVFFSRCQSRYAISSALFLSVPWLDSARVLTIAPVVLTPVWGLLCRLRVKRLFMLSIVVAIVGCEYWAFTDILTQPRLSIFLYHANPSAYAEVVWSAFISHVGSRDTSAYLLLRVPTVIGMILCVVAYLRLDVASRLSLEVVS